MGNGQQRVARLALRVHPLPQRLGMVVIHRAERHRRNVGAVAEEDVAVQIAVVGQGSPIVRTERSELAW